MSRTLAALLLACLAAGCTTQNMAAVDPYDPTSTSQRAVQTNLPCDVQSVLQNSCWSCHGTAPSGGASMSLVTRDDLMAAAKSDPNKTNAQVIVERIVSTSDPMPPAPAAPLASDAVQTLTAWVQSGAPSGSCATDGGVGDPYGTPSVCTSGKTWTKGDRGSSQMHPGGTCIDCHSSSDEAPSFAFAGTVYATAHEPDDCNGDSGVQVVIVGANGATITLTANTVGNFYSRGSGSLTMPFTAKVTQNGKERVMSTPQTSGDCNACHTETGTQNAPGRIMAP